MIVGDVETQSDIRIDGHIKGKVMTAGRLVVGNTARIEGDISCVNVDVLGDVAGNIVASGVVSLKSPAKVFGDISATSIAIESGVTFNGNCRMTREKGGVKE